MCDPQVPSSGRTGLAARPRTTADWVWQAGRRCVIPTHLTGSIQPAEVTAIDFAVPDSARAFDTSRSRGGSQQRYARCLGGPPEAHGSGCAVLYVPEPVAAATAVNYAAHGGDVLARPKANVQLAHTGTIELLAHRLKSRPALGGVSIRRGRARPGRRGTRAGGGLGAAGAALAGRLGRTCSARYRACATDGAVVEFEAVDGVRQRVVTEGSDLAQKVLKALMIRRNPPSRVQCKSSETTKSGHAVKIRK